MSVSFGDLHVSVPLFASTYTHAKYHIYMPDPLLHIRVNRADTEGGKLPGNTRIHLSPSLLTIRLVLMISRPSGHSGQEGREPQQNQK